MRAQQDGLDAENQKGVARPDSFLPPTPRPERDLKSSGFEPCWAPGSPGGAELETRTSSHPWRCLLLVRSGDTGLCLLSKHPG